MELQEALDFLNRNMETLTWIGGSVAIVAGAAWSVIKLVWLRPTPSGDKAPAHPQSKDRTEPKQEAEVNVTGNNNRISVTQVIGRALSRLAMFIFWMCLLLLLIIAVVQISGRYATAVPWLPTVEVGLTCGYRYNEYSFDEEGRLRTYAHPSEMQSLDDLLKIADQYTDQVIMVSLEVWDFDRGDCFRLSSPSEAASAEDGEPVEVEEGSGTIEMSFNSEPWAMGDIVGYLFVNAFHPEEWAASMGFFFPPTDRIPDTSLYVKRTAPGGTRLLDYSGPFVVRSDYDSPWGYVALYPVTDQADHIEKRIKCTNSQLSSFERLAMNCVAPTPTSKAEEDWE